MYKLTIILTNIIIIQNIFHLINLKKLSISKLKKQRKILKKRSKMN